MKVIQILPSMEHNGIARSAKELSKALILAEHDSIVVSSGGNLSARIEKDGGTHIMLPVLNENWFSLFFQIRKLRTIFLKHKPDIVHVRGGRSAFLTYLALKTVNENMRPKVVSSVHKTPANSTLLKYLIKADYVISVSDFVDERLVKRFPDLPKHSRIYHGVDPKTYSYLYQPSVHWWNNIRAEFPDLEKKIWITLVGKVDPDKGHQWLIDIIGGLKQDIPNIHAVIIGSTESSPAHFEELKLRIHALKLQDYFTFTGDRDDLKEWLAASNIVCALGTRPRSFGRIILETVSMGVPVVAWDKGGASEILTQLYPQGLIEPYDCLALIAQIKSLIENPQRPAKSNKFLLKPALKDTLEVYESLLATDK